MPRFKDEQGKLGHYPKSQNITVGQKVSKRGRADASVYRSAAHTYKPQRHLSPYLRTRKFEQLFWL